MASIKIGIMVGGGKISQINGDTYINGVNYSDVIPDGSTIDIIKGKIFCNGKEVTKESK